MNTYDEEFPKIARPAHERTETIEAGASALAEYDLYFEDREDWAIRVFRAMVARKLMASEPLMRQTVFWTNLDYGAQGPYITAPEGEL